MNHQLPLISIIVPMHNAEKYIQRCIESIFKQSYKNYEIVLVDDHSTDNTLQLCRDSYNENRIIISSNSGGKGVSAARNFGINLAHGDYITFIDSDDIVDINYLKVLYKLSKTYPEYLPMCGLVEFGENISVFSSKKNETAKCISKKCFLTNIYYYHPSACACLFNNSVVRKYNIKFEEKCSFCEDDYFTSKYVAFYKGVALSSLKLYGYYINYDGLGTHKDHSKLSLSDVNHRAESIIGLKDAIDFTDKYDRKSSKYIKIGYSFIAADVVLTALRAKQNDYCYKEEIKKYLCLGNCIQFTLLGKSKKQVLFVNGIAVNAQSIKAILDVINKRKAR